MKPDEPEKRPDVRDPQLHTLSIRPTEQPPTRAQVNATMKRLGLDVNWSEEAVEQLLEAAAAADQYLRQFPEQAEALAREPGALLRALADKAFLAAPIEALEAAMAATSKQLAGRAPSKNPFPVTRVRFEDPRSSTDPAAKSSTDG